MKKIWTLLCVLALGFLCACSNAGPQKAPFEIQNIDLETLQTKLEDKESFLLLCERDNCPFCEALNEYLEKTAPEHPGLVVYRIDITEFHLMREEEGNNILVSDTEEGKEFLKIFPYFLYTPALYRIEDGEPVGAGIGWDDSKQTVSLWDVHSTVDLSQALPENVWTFIEESEGTKIES